MTGARAPLSLPLEQSIHRLLHLVPDRLKITAGQLKTIAGRLEITQAVLKIAPDPLKTTPGRW